MAAAEPVMSLSAPTGGEPTERLAGPRFHRRVIVDRFAGKL
ncbi:hypothetical protein PSET11_00357 [Arthrobacter ulcerisalmonis]|uniref:Uncharacterized protein n=1 Tax=Arthrobacter ulcerisalmonis TaxID=2483813 RepID=A0A3P5WDI6_9MICC|nr:hypothetical protein [Arthrobacter ulcerisalmonis]VDC18518.1 hypothetical protein PSET11_00357 [Arthrobacter ulcerisalmonis]